MLKINRWMIVIGTDIDVDVDRYRYIFKWKTNISYNFSWLHKKLLKLLYEKSVRIIVKTAIVFRFTSSL